MTDPESRAADLARDNAIYRLISECEGECPNFVDVTAGCTLGEADCQCYQLASASWNAALTISAAAEAAMREAAEFYLDEQWGDVIDEPPVEMLAWLETHRPDCKGDIALARALATPASALAERMMRIDGGKYRHKARGSTYTKIGEASLQTKYAVAEGATLVIYKAEDGTLWARPRDEFNDGRFAKPSAPLVRRERRDG